MVSDGDDMEKITKALIIPGSFNGDKLNGTIAAEKVLGQPVAVRTILQAGLSGIKEFVIAVPDQDYQTVEAISNNKLIKEKGYQIQFLTFNELPADTQLKRMFKSSFLLLSDNRLINKQPIDELLYNKLKRNRSAVQIDPNASAEGDYSLEIKLTAKQTLSKAGPDLQTIDGAWTGAAIAAPATVIELLKRLKKKKGKQLAAADFKALFKSDCIFIETESCSYSIEINSGDDLQPAVKRLLNSVRKDTDGFVSRNLNRYVSLWFSKWFLRWHIRPNVISFTNFVLGVLSAFLIAVGGYPSILTAGLLFQFTSIIDGSDGEVAKLGFMATEKGAWIDTVCDQLTYLLFFIALPIGVYRSSAHLASRSLHETVVGFFSGQQPVVEYNSLYLWLTGAILLAMGMVYLLMIRFVKKQGGEGSMLKILDQIHSWAKLRGPVSIPHKLAAGVSFAVRRDFFAFAVMLLCIAGYPSIILWALSGILFGSVVYLMVYFR